MSTIKQIKLRLKLLLFFPLFTSALTFTLFSCSSPTQPPPKNNGVLTLSLEEVSSTEAWVKLKVQNVPLPAEINFLLDSKTLTNINLASADTTLYIDSLLPNRTYRLEARFTDNTGTAKSNPLTIATLDTTSHNFTWQTFTFGDAGAGSSHLNDVAIIDENNIWAVGEIYMNDSTGKPDPNAYNAVHWDGSKWELKRVYYPTVRGQTSLTPYPSKAILAFNDGQIWISSSGDKIAILKDGNQINQFCLPLSVSMSINKIWGTSSNDLYIVGNGGNIAHFNGTSWQKIESGTTTNLKDIYGDSDDKTVWITGYDTGTGETILLKNNGSNIKKIYEASPGDPRWNQVLDDQLSGIVTSVWSSIQSKHIWISSTSGFYNAPENTLGEASLKYKFSFPVGFINRIRGGDVNNLIAVGDYKTIFHYNGVTWALELIDFGNGMILRSAAIKGKEVIIVGGSGTAVIIKGEQIN